MNVEAGTKQILEILLGDDKVLNRMGGELVRQFFRTLNVLLAAESIEDLVVFRSTGYKFYNGFHQVNVGGDYRLWFTLESNGTIILREFDQGNH